MRDAGKRGALAGLEELPRHNRDNIDVDRLDGELLPDLIADLMMLGAGTRTPWIGVCREMTGGRNLQLVIGLGTELPADVSDNRPNVTLTELAAPAAPDKPGVWRWPTPSDRS